MGINEADLRALTGVNQEPTIPVLSNNTFRVASGAILNRPMVLVEACILDENRRRLTAWTRVPTVINGPGAVDRLDGPVLRSLLYTATQPDGAMELFVSTTKTIAGMKTVNMQTNPPIMPMFSFPPAPGAVLGNYTYQGGGTGTFNPNQAAPKVFPRRAGRAPL
ncbi:hypothetical protein N7456_000496 [Penicillium angulare]|uniref:Uncharacterized protein n=1 Tax=Penicillium angulare TaxID=116970 RepID=A0A9W9KRY4_9EURO|nr:hypothetical protein N7456_000496 [Penicillium angulare]